MTYAPDRLYEEVAYVAYHFHWALDDILDLEHAQRLRYRPRDRGDQHAPGRGAVSHAVAVAARDGRAADGQGRGRAGGTGGC